METNDGGITVTKFVNSAEDGSEGGGGAVVTFRIESERSDDATVRLVDDCLDEEAMARGIAFREEHDPENWAVEDGRLVWTRRVPAGGQLLTGYDVHPDAHDGVALDAEPELASVEAAHTVLRAGGGSDATAAGPDDAGGADADETVSVEPPDGGDRTEDEVVDWGDGRESDEDDAAVESDEDDEPGDDATDEAAIRRALTGGLDDSDTPSLYHIHVDMAAEATADDVERVLRSLENAFYLLGSDPTPSTLRGGSFDGRLDLVVGARLGADTVRDAVASLDPVAAVDLTAVDDAVVAELDPAALVMAAGDAGCGSDDAGERFAALSSELDTGYSDEFEAATPEAVSETTTLDMTWDEFSVEPGADDARAEPGERERATRRPADERRLLDDLVAELRDGISERQRTALRRALGVGPKPSVAVRLRYLSGRVSDLAAYADAIEEFIDEEGTARQVLDDLDDRLDSLEAEHDELTDELQRVEGDLGERVGELDDSLEAVEDAVAELEDSLQDHHERINENRADIDDHATGIEANAAGIEENADAIAEGQRNLAVNARDIRGNAARTEENADAIAETQDAVVELREEECAAIVDRLDRLESAVKDNTEWRERMRSAMET